MRDSGMKQTFLLDGTRVPRAGDWFRNPVYAATLREIAKGGTDVFYNGPVGEKIVKFLQTGGGFLTMDDLRKSMEKRMIIEQVQRAEVGSKLTITEEEARQYYARHPEEFTDATMITLREIMIEVPSTSAASSAADQAALAKINDARARALRAEDFAKLAAEVSNSASKANGGLIGPFSRDDMSPQLQAMVDKMKPGDITQPIRTPRGYQLFKLEAVKASALQPFDSVRDLIAEKVAGARTQTEMRKFLARLRTQAIIEWKNDELKKAYEKQIAAEPVG
jgi:parvulin-like peptidyl-prolyl isomerase